MFQFIPINYWAVCVASFLIMIISALWYSPLLFGASWAKLTGLDKKKFDPKNLPALYGSMLMGAFVTCYVMAHVVWFVESFTFWQGVQVGFWLWVGFVAPIALSHYLFTNKSFKLYLIDMGYFLVVFTMVAGLLAVWPPVGFGA